MMVKMMVTISKITQVLIQLVHNIEELPGFYQPINNNRHSFPDKKN
jgi:hypothetical protein